MLLIRVLWLSIAIFLLVLCGKVPAQDWGIVTDEEWQSGPPDDYPTADAVVLFDHGKANWQLRELEFERHVRIKILRPEGADRVRDIAVDYCHYDDLYDVKAHVLRQNGEVVEVDKNQIQEVESLPYNKTTIIFPMLRSGDIIEYQYKINYYGGVDRLGPEKIIHACMRIPGGLSPRRLKNWIEADGFDKDLRQQLRSLPTWYFDSPLYTQESVLHIELGSEMDFACCTTNLPEECREPMYEPGPPLTGIKKYTWMLRNVTPCGLDADQSDVAEGRKAVFFNLVSTKGANYLNETEYSGEYWFQKGQGWLGFLEVYTKIPKALKKKVKELIAEQQGNRAKAEAIHRYISTQFTLVTQKFGLHPIHYNIKELWKEKSGTPFELNLLLTEMLKIAEFKAWLVLINTRDEPSFKTSGQFNHAIVLAEIDGQAVFMDAYKKGCPIGSLPAECCVDDGLFLVEESLEIHSVKFCKVHASVCDTSDRN
jgi:hypothetical protein